jgi:hypothetical protein
MAYVVSLVPSYQVAPVLAGRGKENGLADHCCCLHFVALLLVHACCRHADACLAKYCSCCCRRCSQPETGLSQQVSFGGLEAATMSKSGRTRGFQEVLPVGLARTKDRACLLGRLNLLIRIRALGISSWCRELLLLGQRSES